MLAGLAKVLSDMPQDYAHRPFFVQRFRELAERYRGEAPKGECVLLLDGASKETAEADAGAKCGKLLEALLEEGVSVRSAARIAAETLGLPKNAVYKRARELAGEK